MKNGHPDLYRVVDWVLESLVSIRVSDGIEERRLKISSTVHFHGSEAGCAAPVCSCSRQPFRAVQLLCMPGGDPALHVRPFYQVGNAPWWLFTIGKPSVLGCHLFLFELSLESRAENGTADSTTVHIAAGFFSPTCLKAKLLVLKVT